MRIRQILVGLPAAVLLVLWSVNLLAQPEAARTPDERRTMELKKRFEIERPQIEAKAKEAGLSLARFLFREMIRLRDQRRGPEGMETARIQFSPQAPSQPILLAHEKYLFVLRGDTLLQFDINGLQLVKAALINLTPEQRQQFGLKRDLPPPPPVRQRNGKTVWECDCGSGWE